MPEEKDLLQVFIPAIIKEAGLDNVPEDFKREYEEKLAFEAQNRLGAIAMGELSPEDMDKFMRMAEEKENITPDEMFLFFKEHIDDFAEKMADGLKEFALEFINDAKKLREEIKS